MNDIALPIGKIIKSKVISPIKASKDYAKAKVVLRKYEKQTDVIPLSKLKKKVFSSDENFVNMDKEISNPFIKILKSASANTTDVYYDSNDKAILSCSYKLTQRLMNKDTQVICNCITSEATIHSDYYYVALCMRHNIVTDQTESLLTGLQTKIR